MMKPLWVIALAVVLALVWCGGVVAGPKRPQWGDPDIVEGMRVRGTSVSVRIVDSWTVPPYVGFNVNYSRLSQQEFWSEPETKERKPATSKRRDLRR
jgi:hypothetical protein